MFQITLKAARVSAGLTIKQAAAQLGISRKTLSNYESEKSFPDSQMISKIMGLYKVPYEHLLFCAH